MLRLQVPHRQCLAAQRDPTRTQFGQFDFRLMLRTIVGRE
jgi:hypothetical protein